MNALTKSNLWDKIPADAQEAVVGYLATRPAAISMLRAINPGVRLNESQIKVEMENIPSPTTPSNIREQQFNRIQRNLDQAATTIPVIPGVDQPSDIRSRVEGGLQKDAMAQRQAANTATASQSSASRGKGMYQPDASSSTFGALQVGQRTYAGGKGQTVTKVYPDGSYDAN